MPFFVNDPNIFRLRASRARALAETIQDLIAKAQMFEIAASYQGMAERAEARRRASAEPRGAMRAVGTRPRR
jgi:hypothetical protein